MEDKTTFIEPLLEKVEEYGKTSFDLIKLKALDKTADCVSTVASRSFALLSIFMFILIANIGLALWIGDLLGKSWYGFFCVSGFYGILGFVLFFITHNWVKRSVGNSIVSHLLN